MKPIFISIIFIKLAFSFAFASINDSASANPANPAKISKSSLALPRALATTGLVINSVGCLGDIAFLYFSSQLGAAMSVKYPYNVGAAWITSGVSSLGLRFIGPAISTVGINLAMKKAEDENVIIKNPESIREFGIGTGLMCSGALLVGLSAGIMRGNNSVPIALPFLFLTSGALCLVSSEVAFMKSVIHSELLLNDLSGSSKSAKGTAMIVPTYNIRSKAIGLRLDIFIE